MMEVRHAPIPLPSRKRKAAEPEPPPRRLPTWAIAATAAAAFLLAFLIVRWARTPATPEPLRPAPVAAPTPVPSADGTTQEYRSPNVIIRFKAKKDETPADR